MSVSIFSYINDNKTKKQLEKDRTEAVNRLEKSKSKNQKSQN
jgi:hypothetical protein